MGHGTCCISRNWTQNVKRRMSGCEHEFKGLFHFNLLFFISIAPYSIAPSATLQDPFSRHCQGNFTRQDAHQLGDSVSQPYKFALAYYIHTDTTCILRSLVLNRPTEISRSSSPMASANEPNKSTLFGLSRNRRSTRLFCVPSLETSFLTPTAPVLC